MNRPALVITVVSIAFFSGVVACSAQSPDDTSTTTSSANANYDSGASRMESTGVNISDTQPPPPPTKTSGSTATDCPDHPDDGGGSVASGTRAATSHSDPCTTAVGGVQ